MRDRVRQRALAEAKSHRASAEELRDAGKRVKELEQEEKDLLVVREKKEETTILATRLTIIIGTLLAIAATLFMSIVLTRGITGPLQKVMERSQRIDQSCHCE